MRYKGGRKIVFSNKSIEENLAEQFKINNSRNNVWQRKNWETKANRN